jgi:uncharacterized protein YtpQ (UPF0354 family)
VIAKFTLEDLNKSTSNPYYHKLNREVVVAVRHEDYTIFSDVAIQNGGSTTPEDVMRRCLADYAKILREHD